MSIIATKPLPGPAFAELDDVEVLATPLHESVRGPRPRVRALIVVGDVVDEPLLQFLPDLKVVAQYGVGYDNIDVGACTSRGVAVVTTPGVLDAATADLTLALILACQRRLAECDRFVRSGKWVEGGTDDLRGEDVSGLTLGIVGLGRIGKAVARRAKAFEMRLLYTQRNRLSESDEREIGVEFHELDSMLSSIDVLTLHCPLTQDTHRLIDRRRLSLLRDHACVINTARGAIIDEDALTEEVASGRLRAGLDVLVHEPQVPERLMAAPGATLTPHVGSLTLSTRQAMTRLLVDNLKAFAAGKPLLTPLQAAVLRE